MKRAGIVVITLVTIICGGIVSAGKWAERFASAKESVKDWADRKAYDVGTALHLRKKYQYNSDKPTREGIINSRRYRLGESRKKAEKKLNNFIDENQRFYREIK